MPHNIVVRVSGELVNGVLLELWRKFASLGLGQGQQLIDDVGYQLRYAYFIKERRVARSFEKHRQRMKRNGSVEQVNMASEKGVGQTSLCSPDYPLVLLLPNVTGHLAIDLASAKGHSQSLSHIFLNGGRDIGVPVGRSNPHLGRALVLEFAATQLGKIGAANER